MKRLLPLGIITVAAFAAMAQTCIITNDSFNQIGTRDTFAGEIKNDSGVNILEHRIKVAFIDSSDNSVVETRTVDGCLRSLRDGASDFFSAASTQPAADTGFALARLANFAEDPDFKVGDTVPGDLSFSGVTAVQSGTSLTVQGTVTNNDSDPLDEPAVCAVVYDGDGNVITTGKDATINDLDEDENDTFSVTLNVPDPDDVTLDSIDVWADGLEDNTPIDPEVSANNDIAQSTATPGTSTPGTTTPTPTSTATPTPTSTP
jgi:hypothetical protein